MAQKRKKATCKMYVKNNGRDGCALDFHQVVIFYYLLCYHLRRYYLLDSGPWQSNSSLIGQIIWPMEEPMSKLIKL